MKRFILKDNRQALLACTCCVMLIAAVFGCSSISGHDAQLWWSALEAGDVGAVKKMLSQGQYQDLITDGGYDGINLSLKTGQIQIAAELIEADADVNTVGPDGLNPLLRAVYLDNGGLVKILRMHQARTQVKGLSREPVRLALSRADVGVLVELALFGEDEEEQIRNYIKQQIEDDDEDAVHWATIGLSIDFKKAESEEKAISIARALAGYQRISWESNAAVKIFFAQAYIDPGSVLFNPGKFLDEIDDVNVIHEREETRIWKKWADSGLPEGILIYGGAVIRQKGDELDAARKRILDLAAKGDPFARLFINDNFSHYDFFPEFNHQMRQFSRYINDKVLSVACMEDDTCKAKLKKPFDLDKVGPEFGAFIDVVKQAAQVGVIPAEFLLKQLQQKKDSFAVYSDVSFSALLIRDLNGYARIAEMYADDKVREKFDLEQSRYWILRCNEDNAAKEDKYALAQAYENGRLGLDKSPEKALSAYRRAALWGSQEARLRLGEAYEQGDFGLQIDLLAAAKFWHLCNPASGKNREKLIQDGLAQALKNNDIQRIKEWLDFIPAGSQQTLTLWKSAVEQNRVDICQMLGEKGADINRDIDGASALVTAIASSSYEVADWLLQQGVSTSVVDSHGFSALELAARKGDQRMIEILISHGADVNAAQGNATALVVASYAGQTDCVRFLLDKGAQFPSVSTTEGMGLLRFAGAKNNHKLEALILENQEQSVSQKDIESATAQINLEVHKKQMLQQWLDGETLERFDASGKKLDIQQNDKSSWRCAGDGASGLVWLVKDDKAGIHGAKMFFGITDKKTCDDQACDPRVYARLARKEKICARDDWHVPTQNELKSLAFSHMDKAFPVWPGYMQWVKDNDDLYLIYANGLLGHHTPVIAFGGTYGQTLLVSGKLQPLPRQPNPDYTLFQIE